jgi:hypothetical protein
MNLVTLEEAKAHLRIGEELLDTQGDGPDDADLALKIAGASAAVMNYLKNYRNVWVQEYEADTDGQWVLDSNFDRIPATDTDGKPIYQTDTNGQRIVADPIKSATLLLIGYLYKDRDENPEEAYEQGFLPKPVTALLYPLRDPALSAGSYTGPVWGRRWWW